MDASGFPALPVPVGSAWPVADPLGAKSLHLLGIKRLLALRESERETLEWLLAGEANYPDLRKERQRILDPPEKQKEKQEKKKKRWEERLAALSPSERLKAAAEEEKRKEERKQKRIKKRKKRKNEKKKRRLERLEIEQRDAKRRALAMGAVANPAFSSSSGL